MFLRRILLTVLSGLLLSVAGPAFSAEPLDWADCFSRVVSNHIELATARLRLREAEAEVRSQQSVYYPDLTARAGVSTGARDSGSGWEDTENVSASLNSSYTLFDGFANRARVSRAEAELYAEKANFDQTRSNIEYDLRAAFAQQLYAQKLIELTRTIAERRKENARLVELRYDGGREHKGSLLLQRAQVASAVYDVSEAERALDLAQRRTANLMRSTEDDILLAGRLEAAAPPGPVELDDLAKATPAWRSAEADLKSAEQGFRIARSERFPQISANASLSGSGESDLDTQSWQAGLSVSLPLFTGGRTSQDILISGMQRERARLRVEQTLLDLLEELQAALNRYRNRYERVQVLQEQLRAAQLRAEVARAQYEQGLISFQDWDSIENALISAQKNRLDGLRAAVEAEAAWRNAVGISTLPQIKQDSI